LWQQDDLNALQVLNTAGKWVNAVPIPGSLVVKWVVGFVSVSPPILSLCSLGDQFARWTSAFYWQHLIWLSMPLTNYLKKDDVFRSTVHRAVNRSGVARYSIPLFFGTDYNVLLHASLDVSLLVINIRLMVNELGAA
jgi:hypothetical protein